MTQNVSESAVEKECRRVTMAKTENTMADCRHRELKNFPETLLRQEKTLGRMPNLRELPLYHNLRIQKWWQ